MKFNIEKIFVEVLVCRYNRGSGRRCSFNVSESAFLKLYIVTIDITTKRCYLDNERCNDKSYNNAGMKQPDRTARRHSENRRLKDQMAIQILKRKKQEKRVDFMQFLSGVPARDYVFQHTPYEEQVREAATLLKSADAVIIGAGAGLSTAAGLNYGGKRFTDNFGEFIERYGSAAMTDMYSAGFYPFPSEEAKWGYWSKHTYLNWIEPKALPLYQLIYDLAKEKPHFVLTTNVDHQFWKA